MENTPSAEAKLKAVIRGARTILEETSFQDAARIIFDQCREMTGAVSGYVALLSEDGSENEVLFLESGGLPCSVSPDLPMPIRGLRATAYETGKTVYENDFMNSGWTSFLPAGHVAMRNVMFAPLTIGGKTVGIMGLANKPADFTDEDAETATVFGELAAIALMNSRHLELLNERTASLERALAEVKTLSGLIPICMYCKKIRTDEGFWTQVEAYLAQHSDMKFSHGLCPDCVGKFYQDFLDAGGEDDRNDR
mgnify:CR=1 FL=1